VTESPEDLVFHLEANRSFLERQIRRHADGLVLARESISDLMQSISREVIGENGDFRYRSEVEFKAWLKQVVVSKMIDKYRFYTAGKRDARRERDPGGDVRAEPGADTMTPSRNMMIDEEHTMLTDALERLPEYHRVVLQLFWFEKLSHAEIARRMQRTEVATRKMLSRAKAQLGLEIERIKRDRD
jgi:RNA polymerase sigma-70 factor (ECF subfamily)